MLHCCSITLLQCSYLLISSATRGLVTHDRRRSHTVVCCFCEQGTAASCQSISCVPVPFSTRYHFAVYFSKYLHVPGNDSLHKHCCTRLLHGQKICICSVLLQLKSWRQLSGGPVLAPVFIGLVQSRTDCAIILFLENNCK